MTKPRHSEFGFTLVEIAIVLLIVTLMLTGLVPTISSQIEQRQTNETRKQLDEIQQALLGYAITNGRFPCPASNISNGVEDPPNAASGVACTNPYDGYVPAATLGIPTGIDSKGNKGFAVDSWNNRIHYAVTAWGNTFTTTNGIKTVGISNLQPDLMVCGTASASTTNCSVTNSALTSTPGVPAVIYSTGKNGGYGGTGADENQNPNPNSTYPADRVFVSHATTPSPNEFDDIVIWISPNILVNRMVSAGTLP
jgi:type II secretory pathway pseudopilin PulG